MLFVFRGNEAAARPRSERVMTRTTSMRSSGSSASDRYPATPTFNAYETSQSDFKEAPVTNSHQASGAAKRGILVHLFLLDENY